jgi:hypothetical protein
VSRVPQIVLIVSTALGSWLGMQLVHEFGHVLGAWLTGGRVARVVFHPLTISRTDLTHNPNPLAVVWAGPLFGATAPLFLWAFAAAIRRPWAFVLRFFAGFCLLANGAYIGGGSFHGVGDCGEMLRHGSELWQLWVFGAVTAPVGLWMWNNEGPHFGLGIARGQVNRSVACGSLVACAGLLVIGFIRGGE